MFQYNSKYMKQGVKFILWYSLITAILFIVSKFPLNLVTMEIFSYLTWYYLVTLIIGILVFPFFSLLISRFEVKYKLTFSFIMCLVFINCVPFFFDRWHLLTYDVLKGVLRKQHSLLGYNIIGPHVIAVLSFLASCFLLRSGLRAELASTGSDPPTSPQE